MNEQASWIQKFFWRRRKRALGKAFFRYLAEVYHASFAQAQAQLPYYYEKKIYLAKRQLIRAAVGCSRVTVDSPIWRLVVWCLQLDALRRLLDDVHLLQLSFQTLGAVYQNFFQFLQANNLAQARNILNEYEACFDQFESFHDQVLTTTAHNPMPWHAFTRHLKCWIFMANLFLEFDFENPKLNQDFQSERFSLTVFQVFQKKGFDFFSNALRHCLQPSLSAWARLSTYPDLSDAAYDKALLDVLAVYLHPAYPKWVFFRGFNPFFRSSWRYFLLEVEKFLDLSLIIVSLLKGSERFSVEFTTHISAIIKTEKKLFESLLISLEQHVFIISEVELYSDIANLSQAIDLNASTQFLHDAVGAIRLDELRLFYAVEQHRVTMLNMLQSFPVEVC